MAIYSEFSHKKMVIFHSYVSLPEGNIFPEIPSASRLQEACLVHAQMPCLTAAGLLRAPMQPPRPEAGPAMAGGLNICVYIYMYIYIYVYIYIYIYIHRIYIIHYYSKHTISI